MRRHTRSQGSRTAAQEGPEVLRSARIQSLFHVPEGQDEKGRMHQNGARRKSPQHVEYDNVENMRYFIQRTVKL